MAKVATSSIGSVLDLIHYQHISGEFQAWRVSDFFKQVSSRKNKGGVLPFIRGLRLSAHIIYAIRQVISNRKDLEVNWGHILDDKNQFCSRECDVIIHKAGERFKWNGNNGCVMDFRFIEKQNVIAVISCKSVVTSAIIKSEKQYCSDLSAFVNKIWLFGECCSPTSLIPLDAVAKASGFSKFWCAYTYNKRTDKCVELQAEWLNFIGEVRTLVNSIPK